MKWSGRYKARFPAIQKVGSLNFKQEKIIGLGAVEAYSTMYAPRNGPENGSDPDTYL